MAITRSRRILEDMQEGYYEIDLAGTFIYVNSTVSRIAELPIEELIGINFLEYTTKATATRVYKTFNRVFKTGIPQKIEYEIILRDGRKKVIENSVIVLLYHIIGLRCMNRGSGVLSLPRLTLLVSSTASAAAVSIKTAPSAPSAVTIAGSPFGESLLVPQHQCFSIGGDLRCEEGGGIVVGAVKRVNFYFIACLECPTGGFDVTFGSQMNVRFLFPLCDHKVNSRSISAGSLFQSFDLDDCPFDCRWIGCIQPMTFLPVHASTGHLSEAETRQNGHRRYTQH